MRIIVETTIFQILINKIVLKTKEHTKYARRTANIPHLILQILKSHLVHILVLLMQFDVPLVLLLLCFLKSLFSKKNWFPYVSFLLK